MDWRKEKEAVEAKLPVGFVAAELGTHGAVFLRAGPGDWKRTDTGMEGVIHDEREYSPRLLCVNAKERLALDRLLSAGDLEPIQASDLDHEYRSHVNGETERFTHEKLGKLVANLGQLYRLTEVANDRWQADIEKAEEEVRAEFESAQTVTLAERMVKQGLGAVSCFDGYEGCWFELRPLRRTPTGFELRPARLKQKVGYETVYRGGYRDLALLGAFPIDEKEVYLPTVTAFERFGVPVEMDSIVAPVNHENIHADWRRARWTPIARQQDIRIHVENACSWDDDEAPVGFATGDISIEGGAAVNTRAGWREGSDVVFYGQYSTALDPFQANRYRSVDELVGDLKKDGRFITDYRLVKGHVDAEQDLLNRLSAGMVLERGQGWLLMFPRENKIHGDLWTVDRKLVARLLEKQTVVVTEKIFTDYFHQDIYALADGELAKNAPPLPKPKKKRDRSKIVARDDDGKAITKNDLARESYMRPPEGMPFNLSPPFDFHGSEDEWDDLQLIEQVKYRRRHQKPEGAVVPVVAAATEFDIDEFDWPKEN